MALRVQRQVKVSKQINLVDGVDVGPVCMWVWLKWIGSQVREDMNVISNHLKTRSGNVNIIICMKHKGLKKLYTHCFYYVEHGILLLAILIIIWLHVDIYRKLSITVDSSDDNYLPSRIVVQGGETDNLKTLNTINLDW